jgi:isopentenyldiphosphate isomerase
MSAASDAPAAAAIAIDASSAPVSAPPSAVAAAATAATIVNAHRADLTADEYFDVLNADGTPTGRSKLRKHVHRDGDWHACVHIWVLHARTGEVLVQQRAFHKDSFPGCWDVSCAGHLAAGEGVAEAAEAELAEELGLRKPPPLDNSSSNSSDTPSPFAQWCRPLGSPLAREVISQGGAFIDREHTHCFVVEHDPARDGEFKLQQEEVAAVRWMPLQQIVDAFRREDSTFVRMPDIDAYEAAVFDKLRERIQQIQQRQQQQQPPSQ